MDLTVALGEFDFVMRDNSPIVQISKLIEEARNGRMFIVIDEDSPGASGNLVIPAQVATPDAINFMAKHGRGLICLALTEARAEELALSQMPRQNAKRDEAAFTVSIEARTGVTTGISAADRARTVAVAVDAGTGSDDIVSPGHVFPLVARDGGVLVRAGHTEAAVDVARLAGLNPSGVICKVMNDAGEVAAHDELLSFARSHDLMVGTIRDLIEYRRQNDNLVERTHEDELDSEYGGIWRIMSYRNKVDGSDSTVLVKGEIDSNLPILTRVHTLSGLDDLLGRAGPRKNTLQRAMVQIGSEGVGAIVVLLPSRHADPFRGGDETLNPELRSYGIGAQILFDLGVRDMVLLGIEEHKLVALEGYGLRVADFRELN